MPRDAPSVKELEEAKELAWSRCRDAVNVLISMMTDPEADPEWRVAAAGELLAFALKGPN